MATSGGIDWDAAQNAIQTWVVAGSDLPDGSVFWSQQNRAPRAQEPAIQMRMTILDDIGLPWLDVTPKAFSFTTKTITAVNGNTLTSAAHGLNTGDGPADIHSTLTLPAPLQEVTGYWIIRTGPNTFQLAATFADAMAGNPAGSAAVPITLTTAGTGTITLSSTADTLQAGHEIQYLARGVLRVSLTLTSYTNAGVGMGTATAILRKVASRRSLPSHEKILQDANIGVTCFERIQAIHGTTDAVRFEPRAFVDIYLNLASEEAEDGTIIDYVTGTNQLTGLPFKLP